MNFKPIKFFSLLAGLLLAAHGTAVNAEVNVENLSSSDRSDTQSAVATAESMVIEPPLLNADPNDETATLQTVKRAVDLTESIVASVETLEALSEETSTDHAYARLRSLLQTEESTESVTLPTEEGAFQAADYAIADEARMELDVSPSVAFPSEVFLSNPFLSNSFLSNLVQAP
ncbi:MAG: hypothetical protein ACFB0D_07460 [Phormidesmis sp.]